MSTWDGKSRTAVYENSDKECDLMTKQLVNLSLKLLDGNFSNLEKFFLKNSHKDFTNPWTPHL